MPSSFLLFRSPSLHVQENAASGRGYYALEDIPSGTILLKERVFHKATAPHGQPAPSSAQFVESLHRRLSENPADIALASTLWPLYAGPASTPDLDTVPPKDKLALAYQCNGFTMDDQGGSESGGGLFLMGAYFNHSCDPNAFFYVVDGVLSVISTKNIKRGDQACITYIGGPYMDLYRNGHERRQILKEHYLFYCACSRCTAPDSQRRERDACIDGIICPNVECGQVIQWSAVESEEDEEMVVEWRCSACGARRDHGHVVQSMTDLEHLWNSNMRQALEKNSSPRKIVQLCEAFLLKAKGFLHPYHRMLVHTYATRSHFEEASAEVAIEYLQRHLAAVRHILGTHQPPVIDDLVFVGLITRNHDQDVSASQQWLDEAEGLHVGLFGTEGRPFSQHARGLSTSVSAPHLGSLY